MNLSNIFLLRSTLEYCHRHNNVSVGSYFIVLDGLAIHDVKNAMTPAVPQLLGPARHKKLHVCLNQISLKVMLHSI